jgi:hypothetical protein
MTEETKFKLFCASNDNTYCKLPAQYGLIARDLYKDGADWYRNNVWHDASEKPEGTACFLWYANDDIGVSSLPPQDKMPDYWENTFSKHITKWAYISDLLPDNYINKEK